MMEGLRRSVASRLHLPTEGTMPSGDEQVSDDEKPKGRESVRAALIDAGARLFAEHGPRAVSVRQVAGEARVNHGLVHRHFGSKEGLLQEVMTHLATRIAGSMGSPSKGENLADLLGATFGATADAVHWRILARAMLDGQDPTDLQEDYPVVTRMLEAAERGTASPLSSKALVTLILAAGFGVLLFEPYLKAATGQDEQTWNETRRELMALTMSNAQ